MLRRGDLVPHFDVTTTDSGRMAYREIWQRRNLVLVALPDAPAAAVLEWASAIERLREALAERAAALVVTRDAVPGVAPPGLLVADRWGEVYYAAGPESLADAGEVLDWIDYVQKECPECEGERR